MSTNQYVPVPVNRNSNRTILAVAVIAIVVVGVLASFIGASVFYTQNKVIPEYTASIPIDDTSPTSITVSTLSGQIFLSMWDQPHVSINSTVTSHGMGMNPDAITFDQSYTNHMIVYKANFPSMMGWFAGLGYTVDINVHVPRSVGFATVELSTTNGNIHLEGLNATTMTLSNTNGNIQALNVKSEKLSLSTTNGNIVYNCVSSCDQVVANSTNGNVSGTLPDVTVNGTYTMISTNGNVALTVPSSSSFGLNAHTTNGVITTKGIAGNVQGSHDLIATVGSNPQKTKVTLTTTNGSVTLTGA